MCDQEENNNDTSSAKLRDFFRRFEEPLRFLIIGGMNAAFSYILFLVLLWLLTPRFSVLTHYSTALLHLIGAHSYAVIQWIGWAMSVPLGTYMLRRFVFRQGGSYPRQLAKAYVVYLPAQFVASGTLIFCVQVLHLSPQLGQLIAAACSTVFSYLGHKFFTFRPVDSSD